MFKNYIFDLYGTLIDIRTDESSPELWEKMVLYYGYKGANYTPAELQLKYKEYCSAEITATKKAYPDHQHVDIDLTRVFTRLYENKGITVSLECAQQTAQTFRCLSTEFIKLYKGVKDLMDTLKAKGKKIFLLSNAQHDFTVPELKMLGLYDYFDDIIISSDVFCKKPDPHMFDFIFGPHKLKKEETVMIGNDFLADIKCAYDYGIKSLYIHQKISSPITGKLLSDWKVMNGSVPRIKTMIVR
ncbi:MAG: HAD family hydrolase [Ruminococcus sp.]|nr:HAD family hydrolase [Ruminococcus sp.]